MLKGTASILTVVALMAAATAAVSVVFTLVMARLGRRFHLTAQPCSDRWHRRVTPNTGGIAILASCSLLFLVYGAGEYTTIVLLGTALALVGFLDDRIRLAPGVKFAAQSVAVIVLMLSGVVFRPTSWEVANLAITFLWLTGITNAFNLIDNMDGLCAGVTVIICLFRVWSAVQAGDPHAALLLAILAGGYGGFLVFNYPPAKIFMGDGGSIYAGFLLGALAIASPVPHTRAFVSGLFYPALTFLYPIFDTVLVSVLRGAAGRPITVGGRDHSSHRLASLGLSERQVIWLLWALTAAGSIAGLLTAWMPIGVIAVAALLAVGISLFGVFLGTLPNFGGSASGPMGANWIRRLIPTLRAGVTLMIDVMLAGVALLSAFLVRWEESFLGPPLEQFFYSLPIMMACHTVVCLAFRSFNCGWRWVGMRDLLVLGPCVLLGATLSVFALWMAGFRGYSRGVVVLYTVLLFCFTVGLRALLSLFWHALVPARGRQKAAILGGGAAGELAVLVLQRHADADACPVVILDTDPASDRMRVHASRSAMPAWIRLASCEARERIF